jgi:ADP-dependent NAD(P)H-hydrate dehydratase / NAD(P)H-hydrate epimerase
VTGLEPLYTADEMKAAEAGHDVDAMMERAGGAVAEIVARDYPAARVVAVCGKGANGGDGRIAAAKLGAEVVEVGAPLPQADVVIDAIFGTGFHGEPREEAARSIDAIRSAGVPVISVDVPSGVNASTGEIVGAVVQADATVTFHGEKVGLAVAPGSLQSDRLEVADIGLEPAETAHARVTSEIAGLIPARSRGGNKYRSGSVLVVGGAPGMTGAVSLAAKAAFRADAGYVTICTPHQSMLVVEIQVLEAVKRRLEKVMEATERASALALGPGLGRDDSARRLVRRLLEEAELPAVVDADALYGLEPFERTAPTVLTPHSGELARLLDVETRWVDAHRLDAARQAVERFRCVVLLKGSDTIVAAPEARTLITAGTPRLATAGTGDVLTGIVGAFLSKGMDAQLAAAAAARVHVDAALAWPHGRGLVASDVIAELPGVLDAAL